MGLRERKKEQTRRRIAETAQRLFGERGFDGVTVAEVAREAEVSAATLFNYFPGKDALFYSGLEAFGEHLLTAVTTRPVGQPAAAAVREFLLGSGELIDRISAGDADALAQARRTASIIQGSPALRAREQSVLAAIADRLAAHLRSEGADEVDEVLAATVAHALLGVHRALLAHARRRLLAGDRIESLADDLRERGAAAFALLEDGLRGAARRPA